MATANGVPQDVELKLYKITYREHGYGDVYVLATDATAAEEAHATQVGYNLPTVQTIKQVAPQDSGSAISGNCETTLWIQKQQLKEEVN